MYDTAIYTICWITWAVCAYLFLWNREDFMVLEGWCTISGIMMFWFLGGQWCRYEWWLLFYFWDVLCVHDYTEIRWILGYRHEIGERCGRVVQRLGDGVSPFFRCVCQRDDVVVWYLNQDGVDSRISINVQNINQQTVACDADVYNYSLVLFF